ncbi:MAG: hypothetical protein AAF497_14565 [Planctomycetota bacterium]
MKQIGILSTFAIAMALLEAAVVVYMRQLYYPENPLELFPLAFLDSFDPMVELSREVSTIVMILAVAFLAEASTWTKRFAAFVFVFGLWDLFYYVWLKVLIDWPQSWWEWDVLFLIPAVWLGPWICPALIALLFTFWGGWVLISKSEFAFSPTCLTIFTIGAIVGLITFFQPAIAYESQHGAGTLNQFEPDGFWWWMFWPAFAAMTAGLLMTRTNRNVAK